MGDKVFLSYAASDRHRIESAIAQFPGLRMADSLESELQSGDDVRAIIRDRVQSANRVVVFWSAAAATSQYVQYELGMADALDKPTTIVQLDQTKPELPAHLLENVVHLEGLSVAAG
jgi:peptidase E